MATLDPLPAPAAQPAAPPAGGAHHAQPAAVVARLPWPRPDGGAPGEIVLRRYAGERELPAIMALMAAELSEPYSIFTFRHFVDGWPELCFVVSARARAAGCVGEPCWRSMP
jgi:N-alpha-acetyltransferase 30